MPLLSVSAPETAETSSSAILLFWTSVIVADRETASLFAVTTTSPSRYVLVESGSGSAVRAWGKRTAIASGARERRILITEVWVYLPGMQWENVCEIVLKVKSFPA